MGIYLRHAAEFESRKRKEKFTHQCRKSYVSVAKPRTLLFPVPQDWQEGTTGEGTHWHANFSIAVHKHKPCNAALVVADVLQILLWKLLLMDRNSLRKMLVTCISGQVPYLQFVMPSTKLH